MKDLKAISYENLKKLVFAVKTYGTEENRIYNESKCCISLFDNEDLSAPVNAIVDYLDSILGISGDEASYFIYDCEYGERDFFGESTIKVGYKEYKITDFDSWYNYLLETESVE